MLDKSTVKNLKQFYKSQNRNANSIKNAFIVIWWIFFVAFVAVICNFIIKFKNFHTNDLPLNIGLITISFSVVAIGALFIIRNFPPKTYIIKEYNNKPILAYIKEESSDQSLCLKIDDKVEKINFSRFDDSLEIALPSSTDIVANALPEAELLAILIPYFYNTVAVRSVSLVALEKQVGDDVIKVVYNVKKNKIAILINNKVI